MAHFQCNYMKEILTEIRYLAKLPSRSERQMDARIRNKFEARASIIKALAHPTRLFIVDEIAKGERCVCELTEMIGADMSTVSKHLSVLKLAGLVSDEKRGLMVYYRLTTPCLTGLFNCVEGVLRSREERRLAEAQD